MLASLLSATLALAAAAPLSAPAAPSAPVEALQILPAEQIMQVPPELSRLFREQVRDRSRLARSEGLQDLADFLFKPEGLGLRYRHDASHSVAEVYASREANCLGFTLLVVALAREAGLEAYAQEIRDTLTWRREGETVFRTQHINAGIRLGVRRFTIDVAADEVLARDPPEPISDARLLAHYYNNHAAERLADGALDEALRLVDEALRQDPSLAAALSNRGVILARRGEDDAAERAYRGALAVDAQHAGALTNLAQLLRRQQREGEARQLQRQLERIQLIDPFHHFLLAMNAEGEGDLSRALRHYRRAIRLHRHEHRFFFGLARVHLLRGEFERAGQALELARDLSQGATQHQYQAKLERLRGPRA